MKMVFDEWYGEISYAQRTAYRKHNVSQSDHDMIVERLADDHAAITKYVKWNASNNGGMFSVFNMDRDDILLGGR